MPKLRPAATLGLLGIGALLVFLCHVGVGSYMWITPWGVAQEILRGPMQNPTKSNIVVWAIRLPRGLGCVCIGGILGVVGSAFQAQLRNRLAEPYVIGVASGAAVGGAIVPAGALGGLDGVVFTAGIGEHAPEVRAMVAERLAWRGVVLDGAANKRGEGLISTPASGVAVWVIPTDEEWMLASHSLALLPT